MKITKVSFRRIYNMGHYENVQIELEAVVENDDVQDTLTKLAKEAEAFYIAEVQ